MYENLEILLESVVPFIADKFPEVHRFHQNNNPKHSVKYHKSFLNDWVKSPPKSYDLDQICLN